MLKMVKTQNPEKDYPSNMGQKWTNQEETLLLQELNKNIDIETIAKLHNRTIGGINSRRSEIAYKLYTNNNSIEEIMLKTKLHEEQITEIIKKRQNNRKKHQSIVEDNKPYSIENELYEIKNEIYEIKNDMNDIKKTLKELVEMMKAVYEFEDT